MSKLDEIRKLAEAAQDDPWFKVEAVYKALCVSDITVSPDRDARFIAAMSPATVLKLLQMIAHLRAGIVQIRVHLDEEFLRDYVTSLLLRIDEIERSL